MRTFRSRSSSTRAKRSFDWVGANALFAAVAAGANAQFWVIDPQVLREKYTDPTLMRTLVNATGIMSAVAVSGAVYQGVGIGFIRALGDPDSNAVPGLFPNVIDDPEADWVGRFVIPLTPAGVSQTLFVQAGGRQEGLATRRKFGVGEGLLCCIQNVTVATTVSMNVSVRCLLKE